MVITFRTKKLERLLNSEQAMRREFEPGRVRKLMNRLRELRDMPDLGAMQTLPYARCHPLTGDRDGEWSVDLDLPWVLVFCSAHDPEPRPPAGEIDVGRITAIRVLEVTRDTHDRGHH